jgi:hypothetical protein
MPVQERTPHADNDVFRHKEMPLTHFTVPVDGSKICGVCGSYDSSNEDYIQLSLFSYHKLVSSIFTRPV